MTGSTNIAAHLMYAARCGWGRPWARDLCGLSRPITTCQLYLDSCMRLRFQFLLSWLISGWGGGDRAGWSTRRMRHHV